MFDAASGAAGGRAELWRYTAPYRGLEAMEEKDSDYFFGRTGETIEALTRSPRARPAASADRQFGRRQIFAGAGGRSGGAQTSGLARRRARLRRMAGGLSEQPPLVLSDAQARRRAAQGAGRMLSRRLAIRCDRSRAGRRSSRDGSSSCSDKAKLPDLIDATERRYTELDQPKPPAFFLYVDQGEELYVRAEERRATAFLRTHWRRRSPIRAFVS